jgi:hypothetical protein
VTESKAQTLQQRFGFADVDLKNPKHDDIMLWLNERVVEFGKAILAWKLAYSETLLASLQSEACQSVDGFISEIKAQIEQNIQTLRSDEKSSEGKPIDQWRINHTQKTIDGAKAALAKSEEWTTLPEPPHNFFDYDIDWEYPVMAHGYKQRDYMIGFVDMHLSVTCGRSLELTRAKYDSNYQSVVLPSWDLGIDGGSIYFEVKTAIPSIGELIRQINMYREYLKSQRFYVVSPDDKAITLLSQQGIGFIRYPTGEIFKCKR